MKQEMFCLSLGCCSLAMLSSCLYLYAILNQDEIVVQKVVKNLASTEMTTTQTNINRETFKWYYARGRVMALRENNEIASSVEFACASEVFLTSCHNEGMAAMMLITLDHISLCRKIGAKPTVFWRNCYTVCPKDATINAWKIYFQPVNPDIEKKAKKVLCLGNNYGPEDLWVVTSNLVKANASLFQNRPEGNLLNLSFRKRNGKFKGERAITPEIRKKANAVLQEYFQVAPKIEMMVDQFYSKHLSNHNVLAVHIRGTDHFLETEEGKLPSFTAWIQNAKRLLKSLPSLNKIFIASDNTESIKRFVQEFGDKVVYTKALRAKKYDGPPVHFSGADPYMIGSQVLVDILLMAKCKHFLHAESSVAALVTYFNPDIESHFLEVKDELLTDAKFVSEEMKFGPLSGEELEDELDEAFPCFEQNSRYSVCPNIHKGKFINIKSLI